MFLAPSHVLVIVSLISSYLTRDSLLHVLTKEIYALDSSHDALVRSSPHVDVQVRDLSYL